MEAPLSTRRITRSPLPPPPHPPMSDESSHLASLFFPLLIDESLDRFFNLDAFSVVLPEMRILTYDANSPFFNLDGFSAEKRAAAGSDSDSVSVSVSAALFSRSRTKNATAWWTQTHQPRATLHDITNVDSPSPIVGHAAGGRGLHATADTTPRPTPGSREAQALLGVSRSPTQLLASMPEIWPVVSAPREGLLLHDGAATAVACVLDEDELLFSKLLVTAASLPPPLPEEKLSECQLNRVLVFGDYPEKSDESSGPAISSSVSLQETSTGNYMKKSSSPEAEDDHDSSSVWSIEGHRCSHKDHEEYLGLGLGYPHSWTSIFILCTS